MRNILVCDDDKEIVPGDMSASSIEEIESVIKAHKATGHQDEMVR